MKIQLNALFIAMCTLGLAACNDNNDEQNMVIPTQPQEQTPNSIALKKIGGFNTGIFAKSAAEIPAYDAASKRLFVVNAQKGVVDVLDASQPENPKYIGELSARSLLDGSEVNSVAVQNGVVALAVQAKTKTDNGIVAFYKASDLTFISQIGVGALPDMLIFTADQQSVLVANEGEPSDDYQIDPEGSISIINIKDIKNPTIKTADFKSFNGQEKTLKEKGIRIFGPNATAAQDFEPEYISLSKDGKTAWVSLQENNAIAKVDIVQAKILAVYPLGFKDHGLVGQGMDVSDLDLVVDGKATGPKINIQPWLGVRGLYMPDAISSYEVNGRTYIVTANEGDARAWGEDNKAYWNGDASKGFVEEWRVKHLFHKDGFDRRKGDDLPPQLRNLASGAELNPTTFTYCGATADGKAGNCREDFMLGRLNITWTEGYQKNTDGTPKLNERGHLVYDNLYSFGARSVSIWTENESKTGLDLVWDSGDQFEQYIAKNHPEVFNFNHEEAGLDNRSDNKGPEPEGATLGKIGEKTFAFIGLERVGGVMVYDVSNPSKPIFNHYINSRNFKATTAQIEANQAGDLGPEGLVFIAAKDSPNGKPLVIVGNEVSGSTAVYKVELQ